MVTEYTLKEKLLIYSLLLILNDNVVLKVWQVKFNRNPGNIYMMEIFFNTSRFPTENNQLNVSLSGKNATLKIFKITSK